MLLLCVGFGCWLWATDLFLAIVGFVLRVGLIWWFGYCVDVGLFGLLWLGGGGFAVIGGRLRCLVVVNSVGVCFFGCWFDLVVHLVCCWLCCLVFLFRCGVIWFVLCC